MWICGRDRREIKIQLLQTGNRKCATLINSLRRWLASGRNDKRQHTNGNVRNFKESLENYLWSGFLKWKSYRKSVAYLNAWMQIAMACAMSPVLSYRVKWQVCPGNLFSPLYFRSYLFFGYDYWQVVYSKSPVRDKYTCGFPCIFQMSSDVNNLLHAFLPLKHLVLFHHYYSRFFKNAWDK